jgi:hypothetical protein
VPAGSASGALLGLHHSLNQQWPFLRTLGGGSSSGASAKSVAGAQSTPGGKTSQAAAPAAAPSGSSSSPAELAISGLKSGLLLSCLCNFETWSPSGSSPCSFAPLAYATSCLLLLASNSASTRRIIRNRVTVPYLLQALSRLTASRHRSKGDAGWLPVARANILGLVRLVLTGDLSFSLSFASSSISEQLPPSDPFALQRWRWREEELDAFFLVGGLAKARIRTPLNLSAASLPLSAVVVPVGLSSPTSPTAADAIAGNVPSTVLYGDGGEGLLKLPSEAEGGEDDEDRHTEDILLCLRDLAFSSKDASKETLRMLASPSVCLPLAAEKASNQRSFGEKLKQLSVKIAPAAIASNVAAASSPTASQWSLNRALRHIQRRERDLLDRSNELSSSAVAVADAEAVRDALQAGSLEGNQCFILIDGQGSAGGKLFVLDDDHNQEHADNAIVPLTLAASIVQQAIADGAGHGARSVLSDLSVNLSPGRSHHHPHHHQRGPSHASSNPSGYRSRGLTGASLYSLGGANGSAASTGSLSGLLERLGVDENNNVATAAVGGVTSVNTSSATAALLDSSFAAVHVPRDRFGSTASSWLHVNTNAPDRILPAASRSRAASFGVLPSSSSALLYGTLSGGSFIQPQQQQQQQYPRPLSRRVSMASVGSLHNNLYGFSSPDLQLLEAENDQQQQQAADQEAKLLLSASNAASSHLSEAVKKVLGDERIFGPAELLFRLTMSPSRKVRLLAGDFILSLVELASLNGVAVGGGVDLGSLTSIVPSMPSTAVALVAESVEGKARRLWRLSAPLRGPKPFFNVNMLSLGSLTSLVRQAATQASNALGLRYTIAGNDSASQADEALRLLLSTFATDSATSPAPATSSTNVVSPLVHALASSLVEAVSRAAATATIKTSTSRSQERKSSDDNVLRLILQPLSSASARAREASEAGFGANGTLSIDQLSSQHTRSIGGSTGGGYASRALSLRGYRLQPPQMITTSSSSSGSEKPAGLSLFSLFPKLGGSSAALDKQHRASEAEEARRQAASIAAAAVFVHGSIAVPAAGSASLPVGAIPGLSGFAGNMPILGRVEVPVEITTTTTYVTAADGVTVLRKRSTSRVSRVPSIDSLTSLEERGYLDDARSVGGRSTGSDATAMTGQQPADEDETYEDPARDQAVLHESHSDHDIGAAMDALDGIFGGGGVPMPARTQTAASATAHKASVPTIARNTVPSKRSLSQQLSYSMSRPTNAQQQQLVARPREGSISEGPSSSSSAAVHAARASMRARGYSISSTSSQQQQQQQQTTLQHRGPQYQSQQAFWYDEAASGAHQSFDALVAYGNAAINSSNTNPSFPFSEDNTGASTANADGDYQQQQPVPEPPKTAVVVAVDVEVLLLQLSANLLSSSAANSSSKKGDDAGAAGSGWLSALSSHLARLKIQASKASSGGGSSSASVLSPSSAQQQQDIRTATGFRRGRQPSSASSTVQPPSVTATASSVPRYRASSTGTVESSFFFTPSNNNSTAASIVGAGGVRPSVTSPTSGGSSSSSSAAKSSATVASSIFNVFPDAAALTTALGTVLLQQEVVAAKTGKQDEQSAIEVLRWLMSFLVGVAPALTNNTKQNKQQLTILPAEVLKALASGSSATNSSAQLRLRAPSPHLFASVISAIARAEVSFSMKQQALSELRLSLEAAVVALPQLQREKSALTPLLHVPFSCLRSRRLPLHQLAVRRTPRRPTYSGRRHLSRC